MTPEPTIKTEDVVLAVCEHCQAETVQVIGGSGLAHVDEGGVLDLACLQCIADGGTCCSLSPLNRHV
jgi:hypothetical protein